MGEKRQFFSEWKKFKSLQDQKTMNGNITNSIFALSPKKLALYLVLGPLVLFLAYTISTIAFRTVSDPSPTNETSLSVVLGILSLFLSVFILLWSFWLRGAVYSVEEAQLGLTRNWFRVAYAFLWFFVIFNMAAWLIESPVTKDNDGYMQIIRASREFINFGGILIAYPIVCHYAARATMAKRSANQATFVNALPFTLLLVFGTVLGIPFMHKHFSNKTSTNSGVLIVYAMGFGLFMLILVMGFIAAITGII